MIVSALRTDRHCRERRAMTTMRTPVTTPGTTTANASASRSIAWVWPVGTRFRERLATMETAARSTIPGTATASVWERL